MGTRTIATEDPPLQYFTIWRCDYKGCRAKSEGSWEGYWDGRKLAEKDLNKHRIKEHDGRIWADSPVRVGGHKPKKRRKK